MVSPSFKRNFVSFAAGLVVAVVAGSISLVRLRWGSPQSLTEGLWAEDGLFVLCIHKSDFWECATQPYAGYLHLVPRLLAWPISTFSWEAWPTAANLGAALFAGVAAAFVLVVLRGGGFGWFVSILVALLPVVSPIMGLESINSIASSYSLLLVASTLALLLRPTRGPTWSALIALLLLLTALTIPSAVVLLPILAVQVFRREIAFRTGSFLVTALAIGLGAQVFAAMNAEYRRPVEITRESILSWADAVPVSLLTYWPGLSLNQYSFFTNFVFVPVSVTGWIFVITTMAVGLWRLQKGWKQLESNDAAVGLIFLSSLTFGFIPVATGDVNNRYFVAPTVLFVSAILIWLAPSIKKAPWLLVASLTVLVGILWWPAMPASPWRADARPVWSSEIQRLQGICTADPAMSDRVFFTPYWPTEGGDGQMPEPTNPSFPCPLVYRWLP